MTLYISDTFDRTSAVISTLHYAKETIVVSRESGVIEKINKSGMQKLQLNIN